MDNKTNEAKRIIEKFANPIALGVLLLILVFLIMIQRKLVTGLLVLEYIPEGSVNLGILVCIIAIALLLFNVFRKKIIKR